MPRFAQRYMHPFARAHCFGFGMRCPRMSSLREFTLPPHPTTVRPYFSSHTGKSHIMAHTFPVILVKVVSQSTLLKVY